MPRRGIREGFNVDATGDQGYVTSYSKFSSNCSPYPQPSGDSGQLPTRRFAGIRTGLRWSETADREPSSAVNRPPPIEKDRPVH
jgi:hypothetical protein